MVRSLAHGDYSLLYAIESSSRRDSWYRVLSDRVSGALSCDCPPWVFRQDAEASTNDERACHHTRFGMQLAASSSPDAPVPQQTRSTTLPAGIDAGVLIAATQDLWPGLRGQWSVEGRRTQINRKPYLVLLLRLRLGNGGVATGVVAFAEAHQPTMQHLTSRVSAWCGFAIAAEVARLGGYPMAGQPPEHFRVAPTRQRAGRGGGRREAPTTTPTAGTAVGLSDILRTSEPGDGLRPAQRAENTLRLFMGEALYQRLETEHFLDVSSVRYDEEQRVYRLRRDPAKSRERRVRVFERGRYTKDFCIVRAMDCPEGDHFLTVWLGLMSDERATLSVVGHYNIFSPCSDGNERESVPAIWHPRAV